MTQGPKDGSAEAKAEEERTELRRMIDALMALPPREWPSIIVVGDENVSAIYPPSCPPSEAD